MVKFQARAEKKMLLNNYVQSATHAIDDKKELINLELEVFKP